MVGNTEKAPCGSGAGTAAAVGKNSWVGGGGVRVRRRREEDGCYGVSEVYSKGDGRIRGLVASLMWERFSRM